MYAHYVLLSLLALATTYTGQLIAGAKLAHEQPSSSSGRQQLATLLDSNKHANNNLPRPAQRIRNEPESVWVEFVQLAQEFRPLNLGQGFPDFAAPKYLIDSLVNATNQLDQSSILTHQYTRPFGHPRLIKALQAYYEKFRSFDELQDAKSQILVTVGAYEALYAAVMAFVEPGDEVLIIDPAFDAYAPMVSMAGGTSVFVPLRYMKNGTIEDVAAANNRSSLDPSAMSSSRWYRLDMDEFESKITNRTRMLILNTPNNPLGKIYTHEELEQIAKLCLRHNLLVVSDEVYEQFYYPNENNSTHLSIGRLAGMWNRTITIGSAGKTFSVTGWKVGWALGPQELIKYLQLVHQTAVYTVATPLQEAIARMFEFEMDKLQQQQQQRQPRPAVVVPESGYWQELRHELVQKRDRMAQLLIRANFKPIVPEGGYFMLADFTQFANSSKENSQPAAAHHLAANNGTRHAGDGHDDFEFARRLAKEGGLLGIPGSAFYSRANKRQLGAHLIRFCFIKQWSTFDKLEQLIDSGKLFGASHHHH